MCFKAFAKKKKETKNQNPITTLFVNWLYPNKNKKIIDKILKSIE